MRIGTLHGLSLHYIEGNREVVGYRGFDRVREFPELGSPENAADALNACRNQFGADFSPSARACRATSEPCR